MSDIPRLQAYLRTSAGQRYDTAAGATAPFDGITELVGIATGVPFRRRGIATCLTDLSLRWAFAHGVDIACLTAADRDAGRVYERTGFWPVATMLAYSVQR